MSQDFSMDFSRALSQSTPEEVEIEVIERIRVLAPGGRYILGPDNV